MTAKKNKVMGSMGPGTKNDWDGDGQYQFT
jgi:hypothetical protein